MLQSLPRNLGVAYGHDKAAWACQISEIFKISEISAQQMRTT
jgi:hypothetical protein